MLVTKPILGKKEVVILDTTKKGTEDRFTIVIEMQVKGTDKKFKDTLFYDASNTNRISVLPAIIYALASQTDLPVEKFRTETEDSYDLNIDKVLKHIKGKEITVERTQVISERNGQVYYNVNYRPDFEEQGVEL